MAIRERWGKRELERQLRGALFERAILSPPKVSALLAQSHPAVEQVFKDAYLVDCAEANRPKAVRMCPL